MPDSDELNKHFWHRLTKVVWVFTFFPILIYLNFVRDDNFDFKLIDFMGFLLFALFFVPVTYRLILYIFRGKTSW